MSSSSYEVEVAGRRVCAEASLAPMYDPEVRTGARLETRTGAPPPDPGVFEPE